MVIRSFQDLIVWQKAHQLTLEIYSVTNDFPSDERFGLIAQMRRSSGSIGANIAEGSLKNTKEFVRFLAIAQGSLQETKSHLILSFDLNYCNERQFGILLNKANEVGKMLSALKTKLRSKYTKH